LLVNHLYWATSKLVIDALVGPDDQGRYRPEQNHCRDFNPQGSTFQSPLHLICNITSVPTECKVFLKDGDIKSCTTYMMTQPPEPNGGWDQVRSFRLSF